MNVIREIGKINEEELRLGIKPEASWHMEYKDSKYIYVGGLDEDLTEGDILTVFSQFGTITDINLIKDLETEKSRGFAFLAYEDQRSTILAVDNFNGARLLDRVLQVDHNLKK
ncbi:RNA-binding motif protein x-linked 2 [Anaeramoeba ignava]|uniref:RNA-binding motif protein x-linked 2 n=1 Tax=Anaeramoeba ignava TaxID=1746090 RepID=A0A9Q0RC90_ANAIG|nr:RNA-binding motif protein x-linked 2 [Anaeramoeba ignava]